MEFTKEQIESLMKDFQGSDNDVYWQQGNGISQPSFNKFALIEAKCMIDRWGCVTTDWVFHPSQEENLRSLFLQNDKESNSNALKFWGANVHFSDSLDQKTGIGLAIDITSDNFKLMENKSKNINNSIIVFQIP